MQMEAEFEHLCRICAANTKSKTNSVVESVFIFKTQGLKDKISRHLYLSVSGKTCGILVFAKNTETDTPALEVSGWLLWLMI